jgi:hypothetical protein
MADLNTHRPVSITVAKEKLQIRTDLSDSDLQEVLGFIDERFESFGKYNLENAKRLALLALDLGQQLFDVRKMLRQAKVQMDQMDQRLKELSSLLEEGQDSSEAWK